MHTNKAGLLRRDFDPDLEFSSILPHLTQYRSNLDLDLKDCTEFSLLFEKANLQRDFTSIESIETTNEGQLRKVNELFWLEVKYFRVNEEYFRKCIQEVFFACILILVLKTCLIILEFLKKLVLAM